MAAPSPVMASAPTEFNQSSKLTALLRSSARGKKKSVFSQNDQHNAKHTAPAPEKKKLLFGTQAEGQRTRVRTVLGWAKEAASDSGTKLYSTQWTDAKTFSAANSSFNLKAYVVSKDTFCLIFIEEGETTQGGRRQ